MTDTDLTTQLAKALRAAWVDRLDWDELAQAALEFLTSTGRLVPAGGMALTAEQVALQSRVLGAIREFDGPASDLTAALALFPATEPAEEVTQAEGFCSFCGWSSDACARGEGDCAPAEPAEEETKAEVGGDFIEIVFDGPPEAVSGRFVEVENPQGAGISVGEWIDRGDGFWALRIPYTSSPVVPAPTETGPWESLNDVPAEVHKVNDTNGDEWLRRSGVEWFGCAEGGITSACRAGHPNLAPFNAAPTETEWQTWQEVPADTPYHGTTENGLLTETIWVNKSGARHAHRPSGYVNEFGDYADYEMHNFAPFVAAEEG